MCPRLVAIAELVVPGRPMADIGTDHALLPAALVLGGTVPRALACDRAADPLVRARATVTRLGLADRIALRQGDGLAAIEDEEIATVVIAGVGAQTVVAILAADLGRARRFTRVVVQPNHGHAQVRRWLVDHDFAVVDERLTEDRERFYTVIAAEPAMAAGAASWTRAAWAVGPVVLRRGGAVLDRWAAAELRRCDRADRRTPGLASTAERRIVVAEALAQARAVEHPGPA